MTEDLKTKLSGEIMTGLWTDLKPHAERNSLFVVDPELDLVEVAVKVACDDIASISKWLDAGQLARPTATQISLWAPEGGNARIFRFLIVQPYVLIQEQPH